jgi:hypothetical protein
MKHKEKLDRVEDEAEKKRIELRLEMKNSPFVFLKSENGAFDDKGLGFWQRE